MAPLMEKLEPTDRMVGPEGQEVMGPMLFLAAKEQMEARVGVEVRRGNGCWRLRVCRLTLWSREMEEQGEQADYLGQEEMVLWVEREERGEQEELVGAGGLVGQRGTAMVRTESGPPRRTGMTVMTVVGIVAAPPATVTMPALALLRGPSAPTDPTGRANLGEMDPMGLLGPRGQPGQMGRMPRLEGQEAQEIQAKMLPVPLFKYNLPNVQETLISIQISLYTLKAVLSLF